MRLLPVVFAAALVAFPASAAGPVELPADYVAARRGAAEFETPEAYELASILLMLGPGAEARPNFFFTRSAYHQEVLDWFGPWRDHPAVAAADFTQYGPRAVDNGYLYFRENAFRYGFDAAGDLVLERPLRPLWGYDDRDIFGKNKAAVAEFARASRFREFYAAHASYYAGLRSEFARAIDLKDMNQWLQGQFDGRLDALTVVFSPLTYGFHSTDAYEDGKQAYREAAMFTGGPHILDVLAEDLRPIELARMVFTEIDHNYVNPVSERPEYAARMETFVGPAWVRPEAARSYGNGFAVFNEYMTWAAFLAYARDRYTDARYQQARQLVVDFMEQERGFPRFGAFVAEMERLRNARSGARLQDLYPPLLDWCEAQT